MVTVEEVVALISKLIKDEEARVVAPVKKNCQETDEDNQIQKSATSTQAL